MFMLLFSPEVLDKWKKKFPDDVQKLKNINSSTYYENTAEKDKVGIIYFTN